MLTIQLGHPKINTIPEQEFKLVKDVFLKLFHPVEESMYLFWNEIPIRFRYREDLHHSFDEILAMIWLINKEEKGKTKSTLKNQLFSVELQFHWENDTLNIEGHFTSFEELYSSYTESLNKKNVLTVSKNEFLREWKMILHQILVLFTAGKIIIEDGTERRKLELLQKVDELIQGYGKLYRK